MNAEIKAQLVSAIGDWVAGEEAGEIIVAVVQTLRDIDGDMAFANAPTYSSCLSNDDIWKRFVDEILA